MSTNLKVIPNTDVRYGATPCGRIFSLSRTFIDSKGRKYTKPMRELKQFLRKDGRLQVNIKIPKFTNKVHRLVAMAYIPNTENKPQVNHIDGDPTNNHYSNLEWVTDKENKIHARQNGLYSVQYGLSSPMGRLSDDDVLDIIKSKEQGEHYKSIAKRHNIHPNSVYAYCNKVRRQKLHETLEGSNYVN